MEVMKDRYIKFGLSELSMPVSPNNIATWGVNTRITCYRRHC